RDRDRPAGRRVPFALPVVPPIGLLSDHAGRETASPRLRRASRRCGGPPPGRRLARMALTTFQRSVCQLIARTRIASGESYVAGGAALNELLGGLRVSRDIDLFHDSEAALDASWHQDRRLLEDSGLEVQVVRERPAFVEAEVSRAGDVVRLEWARD